MEDLIIPGCMTFVYEYSNEVLQPYREVESKQIARAIIMLTHQPSKHLGVSVLRGLGSVEITMEINPSLFKNVVQIYHST